MLIFFFILLPFLLLLFLILLLIIFIFVSMPLREKIVRELIWLLMRKWPRFNILIRHLLIIIFLRFFIVFRYIAFVFLILKCALRPALIVVILNNLLRLKRIMLLLFFWFFRILDERLSVECGRILRKLHNIAMFIFFFDFIHITIFGSIVFKRIHLSSNRQLHVFMLDLFWFAIVAVRRHYSVILTVLLGQWRPVSFIHRFSSNEKQLFVLEAKTKNQTFEVVIALFAEKIESFLFRDLNNFYFISLDLLRNYHKPPLVQNDFYVKVLAAYFPRLLIQIYSFPVLMQSRPAIRFQTSILSIRAALSLKCWGPETSLLGVIARL